MLHNIINNFRKKIDSGPVFGIFSKSSDAAFIECCGYAGFDFIILDMEHSPNSSYIIQNLIKASQLAGVLPIVRVQSSSQIGKVLDIGAGGIQVPHIESTDDVLNIVKLARFYPEGERGLCRYVRAAEYSHMDRDEYLDKSNNCLIIIQVEGNQAIKNLKEIIDIGGYDILFVGPYDLSQSLGVPGQVNHELVEEKIKEIVNKCKQKNILIGNFTDREEDLLKWANLGIRYLSYSVDTGIFYSACRGILENFKIKIKDYTVKN